MEPKQQIHHEHISVPNLLNVCIDQNNDGEFGGRIYDCYHKTPATFTNLMQLLRRMDDFFDEITFPQASTRSRSFTPPHEKKKEKLQKQTTQEEILKNKGQKASLVIWVKYRQNSTWQGELTWLEQQKTYTFSSALDLIKLIDNILMNPKVS